ncbi:MAG: hypothetical protein NTW50_03565 [Candidatus Berkelbacteria bacterium]|nr:hypothetical protein [Candidatus Berkelbacteria bacterium]
MTVYNNNPFTANKTVFYGLYASFFFTVLGLVAFVLLGTKIRFFHQKSAKEHFWPSVRQGTFLAVAATTLLALKSYHLLDILISVSVVIIVILLELFFQTKINKSAKKA